MQGTDARTIVELLGLQPHPEGGQYRETWREPAGAGSAIYFLLEEGQRSHWHRIPQSEIWHYYAGGPIEVLVSQDGKTVRASTVGPDLAAGQRPQVIVPEGWWQSARPLGRWGLVGCTVSPAFDFATFELAPVGWAPVATSLAPVATSPNSKTPDTLAIDVGGTGIKASVLDPAGQMEHERVRVPTPYPLSPAELVTIIESLLKQLPPFDRVSIGFPGMVREGKILSAPHFVSPKGPGGEPSPALVEAWTGFDLQAAITTMLDKPTKVANDADLQGAAVVTGNGLELVVTLGTGVGTGLFYHGQLCPHLELAHHSFRKDETYNEQLGDEARKRIGPKKWNRRVGIMIETLHALLFYDHLYLGGGNSARVTLELPSNVTVVDNSAGILGGIKLWDRTKTAPAVPA